MYTPNADLTRIFAIYEQNSRKFYDIIFKNKRNKAESLLKSILHFHLKQICKINLVKLESNHSKIVDVQLLCTTNSPLNLCPIHFKLLVN